MSYKKNIFENICKSFLKQESMCIKFKLCKYQIEAKFIYQIKA